MRTLRFVVFVLVAAVPLLTSCSALSSRQTGTPVQAGYEPEKPHWAEKYVPGLKQVSNLLPPPTEARVKWDERMRRQHQSWPEGLESKAAGW